MTKSLFDSFFSPEVIAFVTDASVDFKLAQDQEDLTPLQKEYLSKKLRRSFLNILTVRQVHGKKIVHVKSGQIHPRPLLEADGMVTSEKNVPLTVRTADCLSIFIFDPQKNCIGLIHAGWKGTHQNIAAATLAMMQKEWGSDPQDLKVAFGPSIRSCCYEVGKEFEQYFPQAMVRRDGQDFLNLPFVNRRQLIDFGVLEKNILDCEACTHCDEKYFSFRREGEKAGRMISLMMLTGNL